MERDCMKIHFHDGICCMKTSGMEIYVKDYYFYTEDMDVGYGKEPLIRHIEMKIPKGSILTLIGPNGAGKSTILKTITKQLKLMGGCIWLDQSSMTEMSNAQIAKKMAMVLTERLHPELMTCEEMVSTGRYPYTGKLGLLTEDDWEKVAQALELVHASDLAKVDFSCISDGQRQRIMLARALCQEPEMLVLDEPTSFLDIKHKLELLTILKQMVQQRDLTVIMSLHELDLAQKISDYVICVHGNQIEKYGSPEEIFTSSYIESLYGVTAGSYNAEFGCLEMEPPKGKPQVFVISGGGSGISLYRRLQRMGVPFATGVLHENDIDYAVAKALAETVISQEAFKEIAEETFQKAATCMECCEKVICTVEQFADGNRGNERLKELARKSGKLVSEETFFT